MSQMRWKSWFLWIPCTWRIQQGKISSMNKLVLCAKVWLHRVRHLTFLTFVPHRRQTGLNTKKIFMVVVVSLKAMHLHSYWWQQDGQGNFQYSKMLIKLSRWRIVQFTLVEEVIIQKQCFSLIVILLKEWEPHSLNIMTLIGLSIRFHSLLKQWTLTLQKILHHP